MLMMMKQDKTSLGAPLVMFVLLSFHSMALSNEIRPNLLPGDAAPPFVLQSNKGLLKFGSTNSSFGLQPPIVFHAFSKNSAFSKWLIDNPASIESLIHLSPNNTHYVFSFYDRSSEIDGLENRKFMEVLRAYYFTQPGRISPPIPTSRRPSKSTSGFGTPNSNPTGGQQRSRSTPIVPIWPIGIVTEKEFIEQWTKRVHFIRFPVTKFGNWIPRMLSQWYCSGHGCGLDQLVIENKEGKILAVTKRLDARYDWLPSPNSLAKLGRLNIVYIGDGCSPNINANVSGKLALVSVEGTPCSFFTKVLNSQTNGAVGVVVYNKNFTTLQEMNCEDKECYTKLSIPATMIPFDLGFAHNDVKHLFGRFQTTPSGNFFFGIDGQGKLQKTGSFLFPSMRFMAYQAQWFNYKTEMLHNLTGSAKTINIFNKADISGQGANVTVEIPSLKELQQYEYVELDMLLRCPGNRDNTCPYWDNVVQLLVCCGQKELCGQELGRWITAFRRRTGRWLTPIKPLIPLLSSGKADSASKCIFKVRTASLSWAKSWIATLNVRLAGKLQEKSTSLKTDTLVPFKIEPLFRGGRFDRNYNTKYRPITIIPPANSARVELVGVVTGHGSDNNDCAEFCVTSHHFVVNSRYTNTRVFKNAGTAMGCAERVGEGVVPNEYDTWLFGRDSWCPGQDVVPWVVDVTQQVVDGNNNVTYHGWFNGTDPNPTADPGEIIMYSYLVYYKKLAAQDSSTFP